VYAIYVNGPVHDAFYDVAANPFNLTLMVSANECFPGAGPSLLTWRPACFAPEGRGCVGLDALDHRSLPMRKGDGLGPGRPVAGNLSHPPCPGRGGRARARGPMGSNWD